MTYPASRKLHIHIHALQLGSSVVQSPAIAPEEHQRARLRVGLTGLQRHHGAVVQRARPQLLPRTQAARGDLLHHSLPQGPGIC